MKNIKIKLGYAAILLASVALVALMILEVLLKEGVIQ